MEGCLIGVTKMHEHYTWRSIKNATKECTSYTWNVTRNLNLNFIKNTHPHPGSVDQDWRSKPHAPKHASQPPDGSMLALLSMPSRYGKGAP